MFAECLAHSSHLNTGVWYPLPLAQVAEEPPPGPLGGPILPAVWAPSFVSCLSKTPRIIHFTLAPFRIPSEILSFPVKKLLSTFNLFLHLCFTLEGYFLG